MIRKSFPFYKQFDREDCGPTCLRMIAKFYGKAYSPEFLKEKASITREGVSLAGISEAAEAIGMHTLAVKIPYATLEEDIPLPCVAYWKQRHFIVVHKIKNNKVYVADPAHGLITYTREEFSRGWLGVKNAQPDQEGLILAMEPTPEFYELDSVDEINRQGFKFLWPYFKSYSHVWGQLIMGLIVASFLQLALPFLTQATVDIGINYQNIRFIYLILIAQLILIISQASVQIIRDWLLLHITSRININMLSDFLIKLMRLPISFFDSKHTGDILQRAQDQRRIQNFLTSATLNVLFSVINILIFGFVLSYYSFTIFLVFLCGSVLYVAWTLVFMKRRAELDFRYFDESSGNQSSLIQLVNGMQEIKMNGSERRRRWEWEQIQVRLFKISIKGLSLAQWQTNGSLLINEIKNIIISFIAAKAVIDGQLTLGMMLSVQYIIGQLNLPISNFVTFIRGAQDAYISLERLAEIHNQADEETVSEELVRVLPSDRTIHIENMSFQYGEKSSPFVLKNITMQIPKGKVTAIVGPSGSGKTTLLKLLLKSYEPTSGSVRIGYTQLSQISPRFWRRQCGVVMQDGYIFSDSIARNISESDVEGVVNKAKLLEAVRIANIEDFIERAPTGYNTRLGASGTNISGGQKQRILIARSVYKNPDYLLFDEATSSLDANNEKIIMENLEQFYKDKTVVIVAHRLSTVKNADQIVVLDAGEIVEIGNHDSLVSKKGFYYTLVKNQLELGN
ncbi:peptidase domain-containing ABC transporter [Hymenobacter aquaticus]|uniref:Peptidase domain-containing ABC transporter n=2 Tax=Hymenobacter aquaticus TaxID=1867101 RepID=A0A4Z0PXI1_9BACT|nr:peptidase domain-containing ABC transporter [Hymenobacter aquaticus]